jgi:hypothetical protein
LRPNGTILIRFPISGKDVPFDLKTDRYIAYERENPSAAVDLLASSIGWVVLVLMFVLNLAAIILRARLSRTIQW